MYDPGEWTSLRKVIMTRYFMEAINCPGQVYIFDVNPETVWNEMLNGSHDPKNIYMYDIMRGDACIGLFSVSEKIVYQKRSEWKPLQYGCFSLDVGEEAAKLRKQEQKDRERKEVRDYMRGPKESCGTSLADLLKKSGF